MTTTNDYLALLSKNPCGHIRQLLRDKTGNAAWADEFCDGLVHRLSLQSELEKQPRRQINTWLLEDHLWQVNLCPVRDNGWNVIHSGDLLADLVTALANHGKMWAEKTKP